MKPRRVVTEPMTFTFVSSESTKVIESAEKHGTDELQPGDQFRVLEIEESTVLVRRGLATGRVDLKDLNTKTRETS